MVTPYFLFGYQWYYKDLLSKDTFKPRKNITVFESTTDRKTRVSQDAQNVCAITIVGTALDTFQNTTHKECNCMGDCKSC